MIRISNEDLINVLRYEKLIPCLKSDFSKDYQFPKRHHHQYPNPRAGTESTLLLMPAWDDGEKLGVKLVTVSPLNSKHGLPTIQGIYLLFDLVTGSPIAQMDAKILTNKRTAATSALASSYLSRPDSSVLLMIGTGAMSSELIRAHASVRPIEKVYLWGRDITKAEKVAEELNQEVFQVLPVRNLDQVIRQAHIVSCATLSPDPLVLGSQLVPGQHFDMVGAYKPDMREADDAFISKVSLHVDTWEGASTETGDLVMPLQKGVITKDNMKSELSDLCKGIKHGRNSQDEITCFKSVGHALEDLAAANLAFTDLNVSTR